MQRNMKLEIFTRSLKFPGHNNFQVPSEERVMLLQIVIEFFD